MPPPSTITAQTLSAHAGWVMRADGTPAKEALVWIGDPRIFGALDRRPALVESVIAGQPEELWRRIVTDAEGHFLIDGSSDRPYRVEALIPLEWGRGVEGGLQELTGGHVDELEIEVPLRCHIQVEPANASEADSIYVLDADGDRIRLNEYRGTSRREYRVVPLSEGRTPTLAVSDAAVTLVLLRGEEDVARLPIELNPGDVNLIRPRGVEE